MTAFKGPRFPSWNPATRSLGAAVHVKPNRALPPGMQWTGVDRPGGHAASRRLKQMERLEKKRAATAEVPDAAE